MVELIDVFSGLKSHNNFVGSLKYVFFNDISILYELKKGNPKVHYIGFLSPELTETEVDMIPITLPFPSSHILWPVASSDHLSLMFDFKSHKHMAILVASPVKTSAQNSSGFWEVGRNTSINLSDFLFCCDMIK